jgi:hypothetical protein
VTAPGGRSARSGQAPLLAFGLLVAASFLVVVASGGFAPRPTEAPGPAGGVSAGPAGSAQHGGANPIVSPLTGVVTGVEATGLTKVTAMTLRTADGAQTTFRIGILENGVEFPPGHLTEHMATLAPVRVFFREDDGTLVVYRLEDAE